MAIKAITLNEDDDEVDSVDGIDDNEEITLLSKRLQRILTLCLVREKTRGKEKGEEKMGKKMRISPIGCKEKTKEKENGMENIGGLHLNFFLSTTREKRGEKFLVS